MKIVKEQNPSWRPWWTQSVVECLECGRIIQLEPEDASSPFVCVAPKGNEVQYICSVCNTTTILKKPGTGW